MTAIMEYKNHRKRQPEIWFPCEIYGPCYVCIMVYKENVKILS